MRLLDQVSQASPTMEVIDGTGRHTMPAAGAWGEAVRSCSLRYVLDEHAAAICRSVAADHMSRLRAHIHIPAPLFWLEWPEPDGRRTGMIVKADANGRRGSAETFWEQCAGEPDRAQADVIFDLEQASCGSRLTPAAGSGPPMLPPYLALRIDTCWHRHFYHCGTGPAAAAIGGLAADLLPAVDLMLAFAVLLSTPHVATATAVDRQALNAARRRTGKMALLDHFQVRFDLAGGMIGRDRSEAGSERNAARPHQVRGHFVQRNGQVFWRRAHVRGTASGALVGRTVQVNGGSPRLVTRGASARMS